MNYFLFVFFGKVFCLCFWKIRIFPLSKYITNYRFSVELCNSQEARKDAVMSIQEKCLNPITVYCGSTPLENFFIESENICLRYFPKICLFFKFFVTFSFFKQYQICSNQQLVMYLKCGVFSRGEYLKDGHNQTSGSSFFKSIKKGLFEYKSSSKRALAHISELINC